MTTLQKIQETLQVVSDDMWGPKSQGALDREITASLARRADKNVPAVSDARRTDWRGYKPVDTLKLSSALPGPARPLIPSFLQYAREYDLNPLFLIAISRHETARWTSNVFRTKNNAMGISNVRGAVPFSSYGESIHRACYSLTRPGGYYSKCETLADVGRVYAPPGAANDPTKVNSYWPGSVAKYWNELERQV